MPPTNWPLISALFLTSQGDGSRTAELCDVPGLQAVGSEGAQLTTTARPGSPAAAPRSPYVGGGGRG